MAQADLEEQFRSAARAALGGSQREREEAAEWLQSLRSSPDGARVCFSVLASEQSSPSDQLFAAQTLRHICRKARSVDQALMGQLVEGLLWADNNHRTDLSAQLSAALSTALVKAAGVDFSACLEQLKAWIDTMIAPPSGAMMLVVSLTQLPELVQEQGFTHADRRERTLEQLAAGGPVVLGLFDEVVAAAEQRPAPEAQEMLASVLRATIVWVESLRSACPLDNWLASQVMGAAVKFSTSSLDALRLSAEVLAALAAAYLSPDLADLVLKTIMDSVDTVLSSTDNDVHAAEGAARLVEVIAEVTTPCLSVCSKIDALTEPWTRAFTRLLEFGQQHGGRVLAVSLEVWQGVCDIAHRHDIRGGMRHTLHEVLRHVIDVSAQGTMYPNPSPGVAVWSEQDEEDFEALRNDVREVVREIVQPRNKKDQDARDHVLHCLQCAHAQLQSWYDQVMHDNLGGWQAAESWLHMSTAVAKSIAVFVEEDEVDGDRQLLDAALSLMRLFLSAPTHVRPIVRSSTMLLSVLSPVVVRLQDSNLLVECIGFALQTAYFPEEGVSLRIQSDVLSHLALGSYVNMRAKQDHVAGVSLVKLTQDCDFLIVEMPQRAHDAWNLVRMVENGLDSLDPPSLASLTVVQALYLVCFDLLCKHRKTGYMPLKGVMLIAQALINVLHAVTLSTYTMGVVAQILHPTLTACTIQVDLERRQAGHSPASEVTAPLVDSANVVLQSICGCQLDFARLATIISSEHTIHECIDVLASTVRLLAKSNLNELITVTCADGPNGFDHTIGTALSAILEHCCMVDDQEAANLSFSTIRSYLSTPATNPSISQRQLALAENFAHCAAKLLHDIPFCHHAINLFELVIKLIGSHACTAAAGESHFVASTSGRGSGSTEQFVNALMSVLEEVFDPSAATLHQYVAEKLAGVEIASHNRCAHAIVQMWISTLEISLQLTTVLGFAVDGLQVIGKERLMVMSDAVISCLHAGSEDRALGEALLRFARLCYKQTSTPVNDEIHTFLLQLLVDRGRHAQLVSGILTAVSHSMPAWLLDDLVFTLKTVHQSIGQEHMLQAVSAALSDPRCSRYTVSDAGKDKFVRDVVNAADKVDWKGYKNIVKKFCGGKKKGANDKPRA